MISSTGYVIKKYVFAAIWIKGDILILLNMFSHFQTRPKLKHQKDRLYLHICEISDLQHELSEFLIAKKRRLPVLPDLTRLGMGCNLWWRAQKSQWSFKAVKQVFLENSAWAWHTAEIGMNQKNAATGECTDRGCTTKERNGTKMFWQSKAKKENKAVKQDAR